MQKWDRCCTFCGQAGGVHGQDRGRRGGQGRHHNDPFFCRGKGSSRELDSIEWQAQYFAGCLLMPRHILMEKSHQRDLTRWRHLYELKDELGVSISNLVNRLQYLGWIYVPKGSRQIYPGKAAINGDAPLFG